MPENRVSQLWQLQSVDWCPGRHRLAVRVHKELVINDSRYTDQLIDSTGEVRKAYRNWVGADDSLLGMYGDWVYGADHDEGFPSDYHVFIFNPVLTTEEKTKPFLTRWFNKIHSWPPVVQDIMFHRPRGGSDVGWYGNREYREGVTVASRVKEEHFISDVAFGKNFIKCDEPRPGEIAFNQGNSSIPECLHPEIKLPPPPSLAGWETLDGYPARRGVSPREARKVAATNHKTWKKHRIKSEIDVQFRDGLHYYVRWTIYPPPRGRVLKR